MNILLQQLLRDNGWVETIQNIKYSKGNWTVFADTGSWLQISTDANSRVFEIMNPIEPHVSWTFRLIEQICKIDSERNDLRKSLKYLESSTNDLKSKMYVRKILNELIDQ